MVFAPYMPTTGGGAGRYSTLPIHRCNNKQNHIMTTMVDVGIHKNDLH
jgi:hypothetical protein